MNSLFDDIIQVSKDNSLIEIRILEVGKLRGMSSNLSLWVGKKTNVKLLMRDKDAKC